MAHSVRLQDVKRGFTVAQLKTQTSMVRENLLAHASSKHFENRKLFLSSARGIGKKGNIVISTEGDKEIGEEISRKIKEKLAEKRQEEKEEE